MHYLNSKFIVQVMLSADSVPRGYFYMLLYAYNQAKGYDQVNKHFLYMTLKKLYTLKQ
jgi:hypothetical protein